MDDRSWTGGEGGSNAWLGAEMRQVFDGASILVVEDDNDIRELMVTLLNLAGYTATACATAEKGLDALREQQFDFVLTDYALPNRTGGWLLQQAASEGLLDATPTLVVTAHPNPTDVQGYEIVQKPFDLDDLVERVRQRLDGGTSRRKTAGVKRVNRASGDPSQANGNDGRGGCPDPIELILYVSAHSPRSANAIQNIQRVLSRYRSDKVNLTICDLAADPSRGNGDCVTFTPTLVKRSPGPRTFILGHISNPDVLVELLDGCEVERAN